MHYRKEKERSKDPTQNIFGFGSAITYMVLTIWVSMFVLFMLNVLFGTLHPVLPPITFEEWLRENANKYGDIHYDYEPGSGLAGALQSLMATLMMLGLNIMADLIMYIRVESIQTTANYMQLFYYLLIDLIVIILIYVVLYRQRLYLSDIWISIILSLIISYSVCALIAQGMLYRIFGNGFNPEDLGRLLGLGRALFWDPRNLLAIPIMITYVFGVNYMIFLYIGVILINVIFGIVVWVVANIRHPVEIDKSYLFSLPSQREFMKRIVKYIIVAGISGTCIFLFTYLLINIIHTTFSGWVGYTLGGIYYCLVYMSARSIMHRCLRKSEKNWILRRYLYAMQRWYGFALYFPLVLIFLFLLFTPSLRPWYIDGGIYFTIYFFSEMTGLLAGYKQLKRRI